MANKKELIKLIEEKSKDRIKEIDDLYNKVYSEIKLKGEKIKQSIYNSYLKQGYIELGKNKIKLDCIHYSVFYNDKTLEIDEELKKLTLDRQKQKNELNAKVKKIKNEIILEGLTDEHKDIIKSI